MYEAGVLALGVKVPEVYSTWAILAGGIVNCSWREKSAFSIGF